MNDDSTNLTLYGDGKVPAIIEQRTRIANRVLGQLTLDQTEAFFRRNPDFFWAVVSRHYPLNVELMDEFSDYLNWNRLSRNEALPWSIDLIDRYQDQWDWGWHGLCDNQALPWSIELIERFEDRWDWEHGLSGNEALPWSIDLIDRYRDQWDWGQFGLSGNQALPWSIDLIDRYQDQWDWGRYGLSLNQALPWSIELIDRFEDRWAWGRLGLSGNQALPWSIELIERFEDRWYWEHGLSGNEALPWSHNFYEHFAGKWFVSAVSQFYDGDISKLNREQVFRLMSEFTMAEPVGPNEVDKNSKSWVETEEMERLRYQQDAEDQETWAFLDEPCDRSQPTQDLQKPTKPLNEPFSEKTAPQLNPMMDDDDDLLLEKPGAWEAYLQQRALAKKQMDQPSAQYEVEESTAMDWFPPVAFPETEQEFNQRKAVLNRWLAEHGEPPMTTWEKYRAEEAAKEEMFKDVP